MFQMRFVWKNLKGRRGMLVGGLILAAFTSVLVVVNPYLSKILVDDAVEGGQTQLLVPLLLLMCGIVFGRQAARFLMVVLMEKSSQHLLMNIRRVIFTNLQNQEMRFFDKIRTGDIITRVTGDLEYVRHFTAYITYCEIDSLVTFISAVVALGFVNMKLTLSMLTVLPLLIVVSLIYSKKVRPLYREIRYRLSQINVTAQENIEGNRVVRAFAREEYEKQKFSEKSQAYQEASVRASFAWQKVVPIIDCLGQMLTFIALLVGGILIINGEITIGDLTMFTGLTWALSQPMKNFSYLINDLQRFFAATDKIIEIYYAKPMIADRHDAVVANGRLTGEITFSHVNFSFGDQPVLQDVSFTVHPGQTVAIMGPTGCGKTTIVNLMSRFYDVDGGSILLDGVDLRRRTLADIRKSIAVATQDVFLFSDTIDGNIAFADPKMPEQRVRDCARLACADSFISEMPEGYDTIIGERGVGLSGGQKQRIALARAIAAQAPVLVLDDTTSAVDMETESKIRRHLHQLPFDCTKVIIAQRISSVKDADQIIILQHGKIAIGTHDTLARTNTYYREICEIQDVEGLPAFEGGVD